jgi:hypothetical protein
MAANTRRGSKTAAYDLFRVMVNTAGTSNFIISPISSHDDDEERNESKKWCQKVSFQFLSLVSCV